MENQDTREPRETRQFNWWNIEHPGTKFLIQIAVVVITVIVSMTELRSNVNNLVTEVKKSREQIEKLSTDLAALQAEMRLVREVFILRREGR